MVCTYLAGGRTKQNNSDKAGAHEAQENEKKKQNASKAKTVTSILRLKPLARGEKFLIEWFDLLCVDGLTGS